MDEWLVGADLEAAEEGFRFKICRSQRWVDWRVTPTKPMDWKGEPATKPLSDRMLMEALTQYSFARMMPDVSTYDREFDSGQDCIATRDCLWAEGSVYSVADWGFSAKSRRPTDRVPADRDGRGWAFLQRWWLTESTGTRLGLSID